jgi:hypothetical protein
MQRPPLAVCLLRGGFLPSMARVWLIAIRAGGGAQQLIHRGSREYAAQLIKQLAVERGVHAAESLRDANCWRRERARSMCCSV